MKLFDEWFSLLASWTREGYTTIAMWVLIVLVGLLCVTFSFLFLLHATMWIQNVLLPIEIVNHTINQTGTPILRNISN